MNIEALAREAGLYVGTNISGIRLVGAGKEGSLLLHIKLEELEKFAHLIREAVVQELVAGSGEPVGVHDYQPTFTRDQLAGAVARERERLALLDWTEILREGALVTWGDAETLGDRVAAAIRSGE